MTEIKVFSDFACPFCYIGLSIVNKLRKEREDIEFHWYPYILDPLVPEEGVDLTNLLSKDQLDFSFRRIERLGAEYNLVYNNKTRKYNTNNLHLAALYSEKEGKYYEFAEEAFKAIFNYNENVGDPRVINEIGLRVGLNIVEMNNCINSGELDQVIKTAADLVPVYEIESVPTFIVDDKKKVELLKPYDKFKKDLLE